MKVYIITDMEGLAGVALPEQVKPGSKYYEETRKLLVGEVNAAIEGALAAGATEILVNDGHNGGFNIPLEELHEEAKIVLGAPRPFSLGGLDETFDAVFLIGYHSMAGAPKGVLSHTMSSEAIYKFIINGMEMGEIGVMALLVGYYNVPIVLVTGDATAVEEAKRLLGEVEGVVVKWGLGRQYVISLSPKKARKLIREAAEKSLKNLEKYKPFKLKPPYEIVLEYTRAEYADSRVKTPGVERVDERTVKVVENDLVQALMKIGFC